MTGTFKIQALFWQKSLMTRMGETTFITDKVTDSLNTSALPTKDWWLLYIFILLPLFGLHCPSEVTHKLEEKYFILCFQVINPHPFSPPTVHIPFSLLSITLHSYCPSQRHEFIFYSWWGIRNWIMKSGYLAVFKLVARCQTWSWIKKLSNSILEKCILYRKLNQILFQGNAGFRFEAQHLREPYSIKRDNLRIMVKNCSSSAKLKMLQIFDTQN